ncbi:hypothetical protein [Mannheimia haemolytica]|uniref:hypothetical protein n=1 Tax=Mannheimia haemolytica TaxID=75985 RepID=UPI001F45FA49|nr:hypothetical protein [Mannheimia haemolytica]
MLALILDRSDDNAPNQAARFTEHVRALKEQTLNKEERNDVLKRLLLIRQFRILLNYC